ncbi:MAG: hypothetical protein JSV96_16030 [Candidatus Aminicenantes bacterium]|nr:MAG: hypothetical protein JSV96_16030 [Candidatus Aminicenantes bacterium]
MRRFFTISLALSFLFLFISPLAPSQAKVDLNGTWEGSTLVEGAGIELVLTLVLEHKADTITGKLNDDQGYIDSEITEVTLENNVLTFNAIANTPDGDIPMSFKMTVTGDKMEGEWEAGGVYGSWSPERKK